MGFRGACGILRGAVFPTPADPGARLAGGMWVRGPLPWASGDEMGSIATFPRCPGVAVGNRGGVSFMWTRGFLHARGTSPSNPGGQVPRRVGSGRMGRKHYLHDGEHCL